MPPGIYGRDVTLKKTLIEIAHKLHIKLKTAPRKLKSVCVVARDILLAAIQMLEITWKPLLFPRTKDLPLTSFKNSSRIKT